MHLDDDAELYALGLLGADRTAAIEAHLAECGECRARVIAAEAAAASLASALLPMPAAAASEAAARRGWSALAAAAALVFAATAAVEGVAAHAASARQAATDTALLAIAGSHFNHVTLAGERGVVAKALYARDGAWCYVVAHGVVPGASRGAADRNVVARCRPAGGQPHPATAFVRTPGRVDEVEIVSAGRVVAQARPAY